MMKEIKGRQDKLKKILIREDWSPYLWWPSWSPDGQFLTEAAAKEPGKVYLLNLIEGKRTLLSGHEGGVNSATWSLQNVIATAAWDGSVRFWSRNGELLQVLQLFQQESVECTSWSPNGRYIAAVGANGVVQIIAWGKRIPFRTWCLEDETFNVSWKPDGSAISVTRAHGWSLLRMDGRMLRVERSYPGIESSWRSDGSEFAVSCDDGSIWLDGGKGNSRLFLQLAHAGRGLCWHPAGFLAAGEANGGLGIYDDSGSLLWEDRLKGEIVGLRWRPSSLELLAATRGFSAILINFEPLLGPRAPLATNCSSSWPGRKRGLSPVFRNLFNPSSLRTKP